MRRLRAINALLVGVAVVAALAGLPPAFAADSDASKADIQRGKELALTRSNGNCLACHQIPGAELEGNVGPPLVSMKARFPNREVLFKRIWDETQFNPTTIMPPFGRHKILTKQEINKIIDFLYTL